jgi:hypothetical protein
MVLGTVMVVTGFGVELFSGRARCESGNEFRADLRTAFAEYTTGLGRETDAERDQIDTFITVFDERLAELFPERDCTLLG